MADQEQAPTWSTSASDRHVFLRVILGNVHVAPSPERCVPGGTLAAPTASSLRREVIHNGLPITRNGVILNAKTVGK
jgi:hypothetical protein